MLTTSFLPPNVQTVKDLYKRIDEKYENISDFWADAKHQTPSAKHQAPSKQWQTDMYSVHCTASKSFLPPKVQTVKDLYKRIDERTKRFFDI